MKSIVILSGKGGVGKSSITASLAVSFSKENKIVCADCDVDASNLSLLFALSEDKYASWEKLSTNKIAIIVTEPTPSGFSDLKKAIEVVDHFKIKKSIIINKYDINPSFVNELEEYAKKNSIKIIAKIPFDKNFIKAMTEMKPIISFNKKYEKMFDEIKKEILFEIK